MTIRNILVVLDPDPTHWTLEDPLLQRATELAEHNGASLLLLSVVYESALGYGTFATREEADVARLRLQADSRNYQTQLKQRIERDFGLTAATETLWDPDESAAIIRTVQRRGADLVMKASGDHAYFVGLLPNTDWDLLRGAPVPVWFVVTDSNRTPESGIIATVEQTYSDDEIGLRLDHEAFTTAKQLSDSYTAPLYAVHAYQLPRTLPGFDGYVPTMGSVNPAVPAAVSLPARSDVAGRQGKLVQDFIDEHGIPVDDLILEEGAVDQVLSHAAESRGVGLIVMGSSSKSWWDHLRGRASAEPTLSSAGCDVLFVKPAEAQSTEEAA